MPAGETVRPLKWSDKDTIDLYDDKEYSAVWGTYDNSPHRRLGVRLNGVSNAVGYPNYGNYPIWFIEPDFLSKMILLEFLSRVLKDPTKGNLKNIETALKECQEPEHAPA